MRKWLFIPFEKSERINGGSEMVINGGIKLG